MDGRVGRPKHGEGWEAFFQDVSTCFGWPWDMDFCGKEKMGHDRSVELVGGTWSVKGLEGVGIMLDMLNYHKIPCPRTGPSQ